VASCCWQVGQNPSEVINQITDTVFPMYKAFIEPDLTFATIKIQNTFNPFQVRSSAGTPRTCAFFLFNLREWFCSEV
jgi:uridine kinase